MKCAYCKAVFQRVDTANRSIEDVASMIKSNLPENTEKYDFLEVQVVEPFQRVEKPPFIKLPGIQKKHHFTATADGRVLARDFSCKECISQGEVCEDCSHTAQVVYSPPQTLDEEAEDGGDEESEPQLDEGVDEGGADGECSEDEADASFCNDSDDEEIEVFSDPADNVVMGPGTIVWAKQRSWFPPKICSFNDIPTMMKVKLGKAPNDENFVARRFPPYDDFVIVRAKNIRVLGENREDRAKAAKGLSINLAYQNAVSELNGDF